MRKVHPAILILSPVALTFVLCLALSLWGFLFFLFAFFGLVPLAFGSLVACGVLTTLWYSGRSAQPERMYLWAGALALGIALSLVGFFPMLWASGDLIRDVRAPAREVLATHILARSRRAGWSGRTTVKLTGADAWLSDESEVDVYSSPAGVSVWFWDDHGLLDSYSASIWSSDGTASQPVGGIDDEVYGHNGHWWRSG